MRKLISSRDFFKPKTMKTKNTPQLIELKLSDLVIDTSHSGRPDKEINARAKELAPMMEAWGGWDHTQPGAVVMRDDKPHLTAGFSRVAAAKLSGFKTGWFTVAEDSASQLMTVAIRTNNGKNISPFEQGRIFAKMRDGTDPEKAQPGDEIIAPLSPKEIAAQVGCTRQHVDDCIGIFEETPAIAELILEGKVSAPVCTRARQLVKADGKRLAFIKAAISAAKTEGKESASLSHLKAVTPQFVELKARVDKPDESEPHPKSNSEKIEPGDPIVVDARGETESAPEPTSTKEPSLPFAPEPPMKPRKRKELRNIFIATFLLSFEDRGMDTTTAETFLDALANAGVTICEIPV